MFSKNDDDKDYTPEDDDEEDISPASILQHPTMYKYCNYSNLAEDELGSPPHVGGTIGSEKFPVKLYAILAQKEFKEIITWCHMAVPGRS
jgi:hypothetical protein